MWSPKRVNKIFPSERNTNRWKILVANFSFRNQNKERLQSQWRFVSITNKISTEKSRQTNHAGHIRSFIQLQNVSCQLYTFSCAQLRNFCLVLCYVQSDLSFRVLSRRSTDRHVQARTRSQLCNISHCSPLNRSQNAHYAEGNAENNTTGKLRTRALSYCSQLWKFVVEYRKSVYTSKAVSDQFGGWLWILFESLWLKITVVVCMIILAWNSLSPAGDQKIWSPVQTF